MREAWNRLENHLRLQSPELSSALNPPATDEKIHQLRENQDTRPPDDLIEILRIHDGQRGDRAPIFNGYRFSSIREIFSDWSTMNDLLDGGDFDGAIPKPSPEVSDAWWNRQWIPFANNGAGDLLCLDMCPSDAGTVGQVIEYFHDAPNRKKIAGNLQDFFKKLTNT